MATPFYIPTSGVRGFQFLHTSSPTLIICPFDYSHPGRCEVTSHYAFNCIPLITNDVEHFFHVFIFHLNIFFGEISIQVLYPFFNWVFVYLLLSFRRSLYILDIKPLSDIWFANINSHLFANKLSFCGLSFNFMTISFDAQKFLILMKSNLSIFSIVAYAFEEVTPKSKVMKICPSSKSFIVLVLKFRVLGALWVKFCIW